MPPFQAKEDALPLDATLYSVSLEEAAFFKGQTGIDRMNASKFTYSKYRHKPTMLKISQHPYYPTFLELGIKGDGIFLDADVAINGVVNIIVGNDVRKAISDGYPKENVFATDLRREFWDLGHKLFKTTPENFPIPFICGDIFDERNFDLSLNGNPEASQSLSPLKGRITAIHAAALFHLFDEQYQELLAHRLASLLSPTPGSVIFGSHIGRPVKGFRTEATGLGVLAGSMFCHSESSWSALWDGKVFPQGTVRADVRLEEIKRVDLQPKPGVTYYKLVWCITKL
ncbi:hypothetical protein BJ912DRAFT_992883 [Pholiota molesta]|nr:hypothetical protein BJ912DRAFT_992883 [Pholiota molesta]